MVEVVVKMVVRDGGIGDKRWIESWSAVVKVIVDGSHISDHRWMEW